MQATMDDRGMPSEIELRTLVDELERAVRSLAERLGQSLDSSAGPKPAEAPDAVMPATGGRISVYAHADAARRDCRGSSSSSGLA